MDPYEKISDAVAELPAHHLHLMHLSVEVQSLVKLAVQKTRRAAMLLEICGGKDLQLNFPLV